MSLCRQSIKHYEWWADNTLYPPLIIFLKVIISCRTSLWKFMTFLLCFIKALLGLYKGTHNTLSIDLHRKCHQNVSNEGEIVLPIAKWDELFVRSVAGGVNKYVQKVYSSKHCPSLWHDIKRKTVRVTALCSVIRKHPGGSNRVAEWWSVQLQAGCRQ